MSDQSSSPKPSSLFAMEEEILAFWKENQIYQKSLDKNPEDKTYSFYDGPPFITGIPHYGTLLPSIAKDIIPRYQTMKGNKVRRTWGWDTHGLPAENQVEKKLGLKGKRDIEALGLDKFIAECRAYVTEVSDSWSWYIDHIGRWTNLDKAYRTDDLNYMESVMWVFKQLYEKELIYRGRRVSLYCTRCATPLSKFEITMDEDNYKMVEDPAVTVAFKMKEADTYLLAWTTTPWTLPANLALAVDKEAEYAKVTDGKRNFILAHQALSRYGEMDWEIVELFKGSTLVGKEYEPLYNFAPRGQFDYKVYAAEFVSMEDGTGIVHIAPGFGEEDTKLGLENDLGLFATLDDVGCFIPEVKPYAGVYYKKTDPLIMEDLTSRGLLVRKETITHSYPHCWRCGTPLVYKSQLSWYMSIEPIRNELLKKNKEINWQPSHFGTGRFRHNLETAPDWSLSRTRYWGSPIPVWETDDGEVYVPGSIAELEKLSGQKITDLHRPFIDQVELTLPSGKKAKRVKEVLDCWFESGAMPYAQDHYPFENVKAFKKHFPADFIIEYTGQLRGWFYYLHVLSNALFSKNSFTNVVAHGVLAGSDGRKMSKSFGNYPDPRGVIEKYGAEALRLYFMNSRIMQGEDIAISETEIRDQSRLLNILHNSFQYYQTYAELHDFKPSNVPVDSTNILDRWVKLRLEQLIGEYAGGLDRLDFVASSKGIRPFIEDLSTWYIRRNRDRFVNSDIAALQTLYEVLVKLSLSLAPTLPFSSEYIYRSLMQGEESSESVHLADYPSSDITIVAEQSNVLSLMDRVRSIASVGHKLRSEAGLSLRQPLEALAIDGFAELENEPEFIEILQDEMNVMSVVFNSQEARSWLKAEAEGNFVYLQTELTDELKVEGSLRELLRLVQDARKQNGLSVGQLSKMYYRTENKTFQQLLAERTEEIKKQASLSAILEAPDSRELTPVGKSELLVAFD